MITYRRKASPTKPKIAFDLAANQQLLLMPIGDVHYMTEGWPRQKIIDHLKWGMDRGALFLGMGEYMDFSSASQRVLMSLLRDKVKQQLNEMIREQAEMFFRDIEFSRGSWIGMLEGDHLHTFEDGTTADQYLCELLQCPFLGDAALIRLTYGAKVPDTADCLVYAHHGFGSSRLAGGHLHRIEDAYKAIEADIYLMGHSHAKVSAPLDRQYVAGDGTHYHRTKVLARTGAWMKGYLTNPPFDVSEPAVHSRATYVEKSIYMPSAMGGLCFGIGYEAVTKTIYRPTIHFSV